jgi:hypothetical protein
MHETEKESLLLRIGHDYGSVVYSALDASWPVSSLAGRFSHWKCLSRS